MYFVEIRCMFPTVSALRCRFVSAPLNDRGISEAGSFQQYAAVRFGSAQRPEKLFVKMMLFVSASLNKQHHFITLHSSLFTLHSSLFTFHSSLFIFIPIKLINRKSDVPTVVSSGCSTTIESICMINNTGINGGVQNTRKVIG